MVRVLPWASLCWDTLSVLPSTYSYQLLLHYESHQPTVQMEFDKVLCKVCHRRFLHFIVMVTALLPHPSLCSSENQDCLRKLRVSTLYEPKDLEAELPSLITVHCRELHLVPVHFIQSFIFCIWPQCSGHAFCHLPLFSYLCYLCINWSVWNEIDVVPDHWWWCDFSLNLQLKMVPYLGKLRRSEFYGMIGERVSICKYSLIQSNCIDPN